MHESDKLKGIVEAQQVCTDDWVEEQLRKAEGFDPDWAEEKIATDETPEPCYDSLSDIYDEMEYCTNDWVDEELRKAEGFDPDWADEQAKTQSEPNRPTEEMVHTELQRQDEFSEVTPPYDLSDFLAGIARSEDEF